MQAIYLSQSYHIPAHAVETEYEIKKSRFIARAINVCSREDAMQSVERAKIDFPDARHHCWAYLIGSPISPLTVAMNDDGEPSGTAGRPILNVLQHKNIGDILIIVIRYFGGIKLGAGGLVRAYSTAAQMAIDVLPVVTNRILQEYKIIGNYALEQPLRHWLNLHNGLMGEVSYQVNAVIFTLNIEKNVFNQLASFLDAQGASFCD